MRIIENTEFGDFLTKAPLYKKIIAVYDYQKSADNFAYPYGFKDKPFKFKCPIELEQQTFRTYLNERENIFGTLDYLTNNNRMPEYFDKKTKYINQTVHVIGKCQSCGAEINFLIRATSDIKWEEKINGFNIILQKIGQYPPYEINPEKIIRNYLTDDENIYYKKALVNLSISYGIGAFAYLRRILEKIILKIITDLSNMELEGVDKIKDALNLYNVNHQMSSVIDVVNKFYPTSLMMLNDNPIRLLYEQLSIGIHDLTDEECLERAESINIVLMYITKKVFEEKTNSLSMKNAIKNLRKFNNK